MRLSHTRPLFSIETTAGEDTPSIHLYFGSGETRIQVAESPAGFAAFVEYLEIMTQEIKETYPTQHV